jgi:hypothetical protein
MKIEKLDVDYDGMAKIINELIKLYEIGDDQTRRMIDKLINDLILRPYIIFNELKY